jgi:hypothetical protein
MKKINKEFWLILIICLLPFILSYSLFYFWKPEKFTNHGELIDPIIKLKEESFPSNNEFNNIIKNNYGNWLVLTFLTNSLCDEKCEQKLYWIKQIHTAQGKEKSRLKRILIKSQITTLPEESSRDDSTIINVTSDQLNELETIFNDPENFFFIVDHFGNLMMKININVEPKYIKKDISKLLKSNKGIKFKN